MQFIESSIAGRMGWELRGMRGARATSPLRRAPRSVTLPARSQARSGDIEADRLEQPLVAPAVHPLTGTFSAFEHTAAFGPKAFRLLFPLHVVALALLLGVAVSVVMTLGTVPGRPLTTYLSLTTLLPTGLGARIAVHCWNCQARAHWFGAMAWTIAVSCGCLADFVAYGLNPNPACEVPSMGVYPLFSLLFAGINASLGMEFWHTAWLAGLVLCDFVAVRADSAPANLAIVALVATSGAGHLAQLLARRAFLHCEHLQLFLRLDVQRLENDVQRLTDRLRARKRYIKAAYKLLRGKSAQANAAAAHRCPYI